MPRYSIIVPVYNVEDYLRECLDSILAQDSPSEYEAILVDDGSTDNSGAICDEYAEKHPRFRVIHQENQGLSAARNSGLRAASGEFVLFFDSDDIWAQKLLSSMDDVVDDAADITLFPFEQFDEAGNTRVVRPSVMPCGESGEEYLRRLFDIGQMPPYSAWGCMFRHGFLIENNLWFCPGLVWEDFEFSLRSYPAARSVISVDRALYRYRLRTGSISNTPSPQKWFMRIDISRQWTQRYPNQATANMYCRNGFQLPSYGTKKETRELASYYAQGADILRLVNQPKMKIARACYRIFGYYNGAKIVVFLSKASHFFDK